MRPSYLCHGNSYIGRTASLFMIHPLCIYLFLYPTPMINVSNIFCNNSLHQIFSLFRISMNCFPLNNLWTSHYTCVVRCYIWSHNPPGDSCICQWLLLSLVKVMAFHIVYVSTKVLPLPVLIYHQQNSISKVYSDLQIVFDLLLSFLCISVNN